MRATHPQAGLALSSAARDSFRGARGNRRSNRRTRARSGETLRETFLYWITGRRHGRLDGCRLTAAREVLIMKYLLLAGYVIFLTTAVGAAPQEAVIYSFQGGSDGSYPYAGLLAGPGGVLYGTTTAGGGGGCGEIGCGTVFQLTPPGAAGGAWAETVLYRFTGGNDGAIPWAGLTSDGAGNLYGATISGGRGCRSGCGVVFKL